MKKVVLFVAAAMFVLCAATAWAETGDIKIGYVDLTRVVSESKAGQEARDSLNSMAADKLKEFQKRQAELESAYKEYQKMAPSLSDVERKRREDKMEKDDRENQRFGQDAQDELKKKQNEIFVTMSKEVLVIIESYGKQEGYTLILDRAVVLYAPEAVDITDKVIKSYDESKGK